VMLRVHNITDLSTTEQMRIMGTISSRNEIWQVFEAE
jgi:hypothetical protein